MKSRPPLHGYNHNIRYAGKLYHVQTEDSGLAKLHVYTHVFYGGTIIGSKRFDYQASDDDAVIQKQMQAQHKGMMKELRGGGFDPRIEQLFGEPVNRDASTEPMDSVRKTDPGLPDLADGEAAAGPTPTELPPPPLPVRPGGLDAATAAYFSALVDAETTPESPPPSTMVPHVQVPHVPQGIARAPQPPPTVLRAPDLDEDTDPRTPSSLREMVEPARPSLRAPQPPPRAPQAPITDHLPRESERTPLAARDVGATRLPGSRVNTPAPTAPSPPLPTMSAPRAPVITTTARAQQAPPIAPRAPVISTTVRAQPPPQAAPPRPLPFQSAPSAEGVVVARPAVIISEHNYVPRAAAPPPSQILRSPQTRVEPVDNPMPTNIFGESPVSETSLDEAILAYLADDSDK